MTNNVTEADFSKPYQASQGDIDSVKSAVLRAIENFGENNFARSLIPEYLQLQKKAA